MKGRLSAISISKTKGVPKTNVPSALLIAHWGIEGDAHAGAWHRQVSLLAAESIERMRKIGADVHPGSFAENFTTEGLDLSVLRPGDRLRVGAALLEVTQIGKECHAPCEIQQITGECIMPKEGIFAKVIVGGIVQVEDLIAYGTTSVYSRPSEK